MIGDGQMSSWGSPSMACVHAKEPVMHCTGETFLYSYTQLVYQLRDPQCYNAFTVEQIIL